MVDPEWGDEVAEDKEQVKQLVDDEIEGAFLDIELNIGETKFSLSMQKLMELKIGNTEFYSPIDVGINLEEIGKAKCLLINALHSAKQYRKDWEVNLSKFRVAGERAILIQRKRDKEDGLRKDVGGSITKQHLDDWVNINKSNAMKQINNGDNNIKILEDNHQILVERASELKNIIEIARDEWKNVGEGGIKKDGFEDK